MGRISEKEILLRRKWPINNVRKIRILFSFGRKIKGLFRTLKKVPTMSGRKECVGMNELKLGVSIS